MEDVSGGSMIDGNDWKFMYVVSACNVDNIKDYLASLWRRIGFENCKKRIDETRGLLERKIKSLHRAKVNDSMAKLQEYQKILELQKYQATFDIVEMCRWIELDIDSSRGERLKKAAAKIVMMLLVVLLLFLQSNDNLKCLVRPERGKITCINVYLIGNDGAHAYNGNGALLSTQTNSVEHNSLITEADNYTQEPFVQILPPRPQSSIHMQKPTDEVIAVISMKIQSEAFPLGICLGLSPAELYHIEEDHRQAVRRNFEILRRWRDVKEGNATTENLAEAFRKLRIDPDIVYSSL